MIKRGFYILLITFINTIYSWGAYPIGFTWRKNINGVQTAFTAISTDYKCAIGIAWVSTERTSSSNPMDQTEIGAGIPTDFQGYFDIPSFLKEEAYQVTEIGYKAFYNCTGITSVSIPNSITYIDYFAFRGCSSLTTVTIPSSVTEVDGYAFAKCKNLSSVTLNEGLQIIGESAFFGCPSLQSITIPSSVTSIGPEAFSGGYYTDTYEQLNSNLIRVEVNWNTPIKISSGTFSNAPNATLYVPKGTLELYKNAEGWKDFGTIKEVGNEFSLEISAIGEGSVSYDGKTIRNNSISHPVSEGASIAISLIPDTGYRIASVIVNNTDVTSQVSNNTLTINNINTNLSVKVTFELFEIDGITFAIIPNTTNYLKVTGKLSNYSGAITIPELISYQGKSYIVTTIDESAFYGNTDITSIVIPKTIDFIMESAFSGCDNIESVYITSIESWCNIGFENSGANPLSYAEHLYVNGNEVFEINVPDGIKYIDEWAFCDFQGIKSLTLPSSLTYIYKYAFKGCSNLDLVISKCVNPPHFDTDYTSPFKGISSTAKLIVPNGSLQSYKSISRWNDCFAEIIEEKDIVNISITASGNGSINYENTSIRNKSQSFFVVAASSVTVSFTPDTGYRIASVKVNNTDVTSNVANNKYTISNITTNTTLAVTFEAIPPTTYTLNITASGNGSATYNGTTIKNQTKSFTVNEGSSSTVTFTPDNGFRIKSVKLNDTDVTSSVSNNKYTISNITANITLAVTFEAIPPTTYSLSITSSGNGSASYNNTTIRNNTQSFTVNEGTNTTVSFSPDTGYRVASVKLNSTDITSNVSNNTYTISNITQNTTLTVSFEAIPVTTYSLSITASGNGSITYSGKTIENQTQSFTVNEGASAILTFNPNNGYRVGSVKVNNTDVTSGVVNNRYTINNITANTTVSVSFEAIPETTYSLSITASGNGSVTYNGTTIKNQTQTFTVNEGAYATLALSAESGYRIACVRMNGSDDTYSVTNNQYTISYISQNTTVEVTFEAIPIPTYSLSITATGNGSAAFNGTTVKNQTRSFTVDEGTTATVTFSPDNGNSVSGVKVNGNDVTSQISANRYTINNITANTTLEVTFQEDVNALTVDGLNYTVTSQSDKTVTFTGGDFGLVLTVPATVTQNGTTWKVTGIDNNALKDNTELAAIIWNPDAAFTATVSNPNLLLYVKSAQYAPSTINNVVVNGTANRITLADAASGNNFYCPQAFTAQSISYTHHYSMMTGIGESRGWETIALPFDVQKIEHASKGTIVPFAQWRSGDTTKPFWLYELKSNGFVEANGIKAYTPYIISMPNNPQYADQYQLVGNVTFSAENTTVKTSDNLQQPKYNDRTFVPNYQVQPSSLGYYALNVTNDYFTNNSGMTDGSRFVLNMRRILPFEAYMTTSSSNAPESIGIFDDMTTEIHEIPNEALNTGTSVYDLQGRKIEKSNLTKGVYIRNGQKVIIR